MNYKKIHDQIVAKAKTRNLAGYVEKHHIRPKSLGGSNSRENLVKLTAREHYIIHKLLVEIYPRSKKLKYALWGMSNQLNSKNNDRKYRVSSREYERARILFSESMKGRKCTWGDKISKAKKGVPLGPQSNETKAKRRVSLKANPPKHTEETKKALSKRMKTTKKTLEWKKAISNTHKKKGTKPPYRGISYKHNDIIYPSKQAASRELGIPVYKL